MENMVNEVSRAGAPPGGSMTGNSDGWVADQLANCPTVSVPTSSLILDGSPRSSGENLDHTQSLAEVEESLPPIVVHGPSGRVIDGTHRVRAAMLRGAEEIEAVIYSGSLNDAFVLGVKLNVQHGLPLSRIDRSSAAGRIISSHPQWSNRMVATLTGLAAGTVAAIRRRSTGQNAQSNARVGQDGRVRPLNSADGRLRARQLLAERPEASIRAIAREAGISPSTVLDVRQRLAAGEDPLPMRQRGERTVPDEPVAASGRTAGGRGAPEPDCDAGEILASLLKDPSMRLSDAGRIVLRWVSVNRAATSRWEQIAETVPDHCAGAVARLARRYAVMWTDFADRLQRRASNAPRPGSRSVS